MLTFRAYQDTLSKFNYTPHWDLPRWGNAMAGEVGEACNIIKKIDRDNLENGRELLAEELADVIAYATHVAIAANIDLERAIIDKFNKVAQRRNSTMRIED